MQVVSKRTITLEPLKTDSKPQTVGVLIGGGFFIEEETYDTSKRRQDNQGSSSHHKDPDGRKSLMPSKLNLKKTLAMAEKIIEIIRTATDNESAANKNDNRKVRSQKRKHK